MLYPLSYEGVGCDDGRGSLRDRRQVQGATLAGRVAGRTWPAGLGGRPLTGAPRGSGA